MADDDQMEVRIGLKNAVWAGLWAGLGVEDIAVRHRLDVENVRFEVRRLRANGSLRVLYGRREF